MGDLKGSGYLHRVVRLLDSKWDLSLASQWNPLEASSRGQKLAELSGQKRPPRAASLGSLRNHRLAPLLEQMWEPRTETQNDPPLRMTVTPTGPELQTQTTAAATTERMLGSQIASPTGQH